MTQLLPPLTSMVLADEYTLTLSQELRLLDDRKRRSRWWAAPESTVPPGPRVEGATLVEPWLTPWVQLNDPQQDDMTGACILSETDASQGLLIWVNPTDEALIFWRRALRDGGPVTLGCETNIKVEAPAADYRCVFRHAEALPAVSDSTARWTFRRPEPALSSWDVMTGGWVPEVARRKSAGPAPEVGR